MKRIIEKDVGSGEAFSIGCGLDNGRSGCEHVVDCKKGAGLKRAK